MNTKQHINEQKRMAVSTVNAVPLADKPTGAGELPPRGSKCNDKLPPGEFRGENELPPGTFR